MRVAVCMVMVCMCGTGNKYMDSEAPWQLAKTRPRRAETALYVLVELLRRVAVLLCPVVPPSSAAILDQLGAPAHLRSFASLSQRIAPGTAISASLAPVFPRCDADGVIPPAKKKGS